MLPPPNLPRSDLLQGSGENYIKIGVPLKEAAIRGDWKAAKTILDNQPELIRFAVTENYETLLHIAASTESTKSVEKFVEILVNLMEKEDLELQDKSYNTALNLAVASGNVKMAMIMVKENRAMLEIPDSNGKLPLYMAASFAEPDMVRFLYDNSRKMSGKFWTHENQGWVLQRCVEADIFDVALKIVNDCTELTSRKGLLTDILLVLAQKAHAFNGIKPNIMMKTVKSILHVKVGHTERESEALLFLRMIWQKIAILPKNEIDDIVCGPSLEVKKRGGTVKVYPSHVLFLAAKTGNTRFIVELLHSYPYLTLTVNDKGQTIFHIAVRRRHSKIYNLLYEIGFMKDLITRIKDRKGNNMLHLVAKSEKPKRHQNVLPDPLQMQQDVIWFKEVEHMIPPNLRQMENVDGETPRDLFTRKHRKITTKVVDCMKNTAFNCMSVAALIASIAFLAALPLGGGYNQDTGIRNFLQKPALVFFMISVAVTFICSVISIIMFQSILIFCHAGRDLLESSPSKLMFGLATLFISMITLMVVLVASFFLLYNKDIKRPPIFTANLFVILVILLTRVEFRLLGGVIYSTYRSRNLFKPRKHTLY